MLPNKPFYANFKTGKQVQGVQSTYNFTSYAEQLPKYPYLGYSWDLPNPVPDDLLLPFGEFIKRYNFGDEAFDTYSSTPGISDFLGDLTVNVIKSFDESYLQTISEKSLVGCRLCHTTNSTVTADPHFVEFKSHPPFKLVISADAIRERFYDGLEVCKARIVVLIGTITNANAVQGQRDTWWTGAAFIAHDSAVLRNFTNALLPRIVES